MICLSREKVNRAKDGFISGIECRFSFSVYKRVSANSETPH